MKIFSCSLVFCFIGSSVQCNNTTNDSNFSNHTTNNFWQLFSQLFVSTTPPGFTQGTATNQTLSRPRIAHAYMPRSNRMYKNKVYRNYAYRRYPTTNPPTSATTTAETKSDYDYKELFDQIAKEAPRLKDAIEGVLGLNITLPAELVDGIVSRMPSPYLFRITLPAISGNISNLQLATDKPLPNRGFVKLKGGLVDMFKDGDMKVLFRQIANQLSQAFNMSSGEIRSGSPIMILGGRMGRKRRMSKAATQSTVPAYMATNYKIRVRTRSNVTIPQVTDNVINFADFTKYFESY